MNLKLILFMSLIMAFINNLSGMYGKVIKHKNPIMISYEQTNKDFKVIATKSKKNNEINCNMVNDEIIFVIPVNSQASKSIYKNLEAQYKSQKAEEGE